MTLGLFADSVPDFQWLLSNTWPSTTSYSAPLTTLYSASLADILLPSLVKESHRVEATIIFAKPSKLLMLPQKKHCMLREVAVLKIAWLPSHKGKGKKLSAPPNTVVSKPSLQRYLPAFVQVGWVCQYGSFVNGALGSHFCSQCCTRETLNNEKWWHSENRRQCHHAQGRWVGI